MAEKEVTAMQLVRLRFQGIRAYADIRHFPNKPNLRMLLDGEVTCHDLIPMLPLGVSVYVSEERDLIVLRAFENSREKHISTFDVQEPDSVESDVGEKTAKHLADSIKRAVLEWYPRLLNS